MAQPIQQNCVACKKTISTFALKCPHCGHVLPSPSMVQQAQSTMNQIKVVVIAGAVLFVLVMVLLIAASAG